MPVSPRPTKPHLYCDTSYWMIRMPDGEEHALADTSAPRLAIKRAKDTSAILVRPARLSKRPAPGAIITGPYGIFFRYHARYTDGIGIVQGGSAAFTRKGIERKARRVLRRLQRNRERYEQATVLR